MTNPKNFSDNQTEAGADNFDRRRLLKGAAAFAAATAATMTAASAATVSP